MSSAAFAGTITYSLDQNFSGSTGVAGLGPSPTGPNLSGTVTFDTVTGDITDYALQSRVLPYAPYTDTIDTHYADETGSVAKTAHQEFTVTPPGGTPELLTLDTYTFTTAFGPNVTGNGNTHPQFRSALSLVFLNVLDFGTALEFHQSEQVEEFQVVQTYSALLQGYYETSSFEFVAFNLLTDGIDNGLAGANVETTPAVPLPAGLPLMLGAFGMFGMIMRRRA